MKLSATIKGITFILFSKTRKINLPNRIKLYQKIYVGELNDKAVVAENENMMSSDEYSLIC